MIEAVLVLTTMAQRFSMEWQPDRKDAISVDHLAPPWRRMAQDQGASDAALTSHST
jgi:hypothetical protein